MSEKNTFNPERTNETLPKAERLLPKTERAESRPREADPTKKLEKVRASIEESASRENPIDQLKAAQKASEQSKPVQVNRELKSITLGRELNHIRRKLSAPQRALSKLIHQPVIRAISETAGQTVSRPSGLLGGGLVAFVGTSGYLYLTKYIGFKYNYLVFVLLFVNGFVLGLALELMVYLATARRRRGD